MQLRLSFKYKLLFTLLWIKKLELMGCTIMLSLYSNNFTVKPFVIRVAEWCNRWHCWLPATRFPVWSWAIVAICVFNILSVPTGLLWFLTTSWKRAGIWIIYKNFPLGTKGFPSRMCSCLLLMIHCNEEWIILKAYPSVNT